MKALEISVKINLIASESNVNTNMESTEGQIHKRKWFSKLWLVFTTSTLNVTISLFTFKYDLFT